VTMGSSEITLEYNRSNLQLTPLYRTILPNKAWYIGHNTIKMALNPHFNACCPPQVRHAT